MENTVVKNNNSTGMTVLLFFVCTIVATGIGTAVTYASGVLGGFGAVDTTAYKLPDWVMITALPILFFHIGLADFLIMRLSPSTSGTSAIKAWSILFLLLLFAATAIQPFMLFRNMLTAAFILACLMSAFSLSILIMNLRFSVGAAIVMIPFFLLAAALSYYCGMILF